MKTNLLLLNAAPSPGGGGPTPPAWLSQVPEDIRSAPALHQVPDIPTLAKNYLQAQSLVGADKVLVPRADWKPEQWDEFYTKIGRPKDPKTGYVIPDDVKLHESVKLKDEVLDMARGEFHKLGLTESQFKGVMKFYLNQVNGDVSAAETARKSKYDEGMLALEKEFGKENLQGQIDLANAAIKSLDKDGKFVEFLTESGLGNDPRMVKIMSLIGQKLVEDDAKGRGKGLIKDSTSAALEIKKMIGDPEFQKALNTKNHPGHEDAVARWTQAHKIAFPQASQES